MTKDDIIISRYEDDTGRFIRAEITFRIDKHVGISELVLSKFGITSYIEEDLKEKLWNEIKVIVNKGE